MLLNQFLARNTVAAPRNRLQSRQADFLSATQTFTKRSIADSCQCTFHQSHQTASLRALDEGHLFGLVCICPVTFVATKIVDRLIQSVRGPFQALPELLLLLQKALLEIRCLVLFHGSFRIPIVRHFFRAHPSENYIFKEHHGTPLRACLTMPHVIFRVLLALADRAARFRKLED